MLCLQEKLNYLSEVWFVKIKGHNWEVYPYYYGNSLCYNDDVEMAGHCERCGADTHE